MLFRSVSQSRYGVVVFKLLPILLAHVAYGSKGSVSSITNSLFAPVFFRVLSRILSKFSSRNLSRFILLYDIFIMYAFSGMFILANLIVVFVFVCSFDMSFIETFMFPVVVFNFIDIAFLSGLFALVFVKFIVTLSPVVIGANTYPLYPKLKFSVPISILVGIALFDIWYAYSSCLFAW